MDPVANETHPDRTPVARDLFTFCTKEKIDTWHVVMNHNRHGVVDKVKCKACQSEHKYRSNKIVPPRKPSSGSTVVRRSNGMTMKVDSHGKKGGGAPGHGKLLHTSESLEKGWLDGIKKWGAKEVSDYKPSTALLIGQVIQHPTFGKGVVQTRRENKVDVLFQEGLKTLPSPKN